MHFRNRIIHFMLCTLLVATALPASAITSTPSWKPRETVDSLLLGTSFFDSADRMLAYDHHGNPGIALIDSDNSLDYARRVPGVGWVSVEVDPNGGIYPSVAFDRYERPAISYTETSSPADLQFAHFDGSAWQLEKVDTTGSSYTSLAFDILGRPAIAYMESGSFTLKYVLDTDGDFSFTDETPVTVNNGFGVGFFPTLTFDPLNRPMIAHSDASAGETLFSVEEPGIGWVTTTVASGSSIPSLAIDPDSGFPAIAYGGGASGLQFAAWNGTTWNQTTVDATMNVGSRVSLAFDPADGNPAISYEDQAANELNLAWHNGSIWQTQNVDSGGVDFFQSSLAFNDFGNGFASIAYVTSANQLFFIEDPPLVAPEPASALLMLVGFVRVFVRRRATTV